jgi:hypothetical protein
MLFIFQLLAFFVYVYSRPYDFSATLILTIALGRADLMISNSTSSLDNLASFPSAFSFALFSGQDLASFWNEL